MEPVLYQPLATGDGLSLDGGRLRAFRGGQEVGQAPVSELHDLAGLLTSYRVPELLPGLVFVYGALVRVPLRVEVEFVFADRGELSGTVTLELAARRELPWLGRRLAGHAFADVSGRVQGLRPWARDWPPGEGFVLGVHPWLLSDALDPVLRLRLALALEETAAQTRFAAEPGRRAPEPRRYLLDNLFSQAKPAWSANLPELEPLAALG